MSHIREKKFIVRKHNKLIEASYKLGLNEKRLILLCASKVGQREVLPKDNLFTVTAKEFMDLYGVDEKYTYEVLNESASSLYEKDIKTYDEKYKTRFRWVYFVRYHDNEGKVTLGFSPNIAPYLTDLGVYFATYSLKQIACLKSIYSIRLFEFLMQFKSTGKFFIRLTDFKDRLDLKEEYSRFYNLKKRVIEPAVKELNEKSNLEINWKAIKSKKTITNLEFVFNEKFLL